MKIKQLLKTMLPKFIAATMILSSVSTCVYANEWTWDESQHTTYITQKEGYWTDKNEYLAELLIAVNGTDLTSGLDVVICLDRSGSMDMGYKQQEKEISTHDKSCPCLNPDHFYLAPEKNTDFAKSIEAEYAALSDIDEIKAYKETVHTNNDGSLIAVYDENNENNPAKSVWAVLSTKEKFHLYSDIQKGDGAIVSSTGTYSSYSSAPYHFTLDADGNYIRISQWNTTDNRKGTAEGLWDHADSEQGCFDRWMEAKGAVADFTEYFVTPTNGNRVALVPFSIRDNTVHNYLNQNSPLYKDYLIANINNIDYFNGTGTGISGTTLTGGYSSAVGFTTEPTDIETRLNQLFTTGNTDYVFALSKAYNLIASRPEEEQDRNTIIVFLSDGNPYPSDNDSTSSFSFKNNDAYITALADALKSTEDIVIDSNTAPEVKTFWTSTVSLNGVNKNYFTSNSEGNTVIPGLGARLITVGYMLNGDKQTESIDRLKNMASSQEDFVEIDNVEGSTQGRLSEILKSLNTVLPGGRETILKDEISKYFYIPENATIESNVTNADVVVVKDPTTEAQSIKWTLGDVYHTAQDLYIKVPLVLKEEYRDVLTTTYYPTNADIDEYPLGGTDVGPDRDSTGAKLYYVDPANEKHFDTIVTPKLPIVKDTELPTKEEASVDLEVKKVLSGDKPEKDTTFTFTLETLENGPMPSGSSNGERTITITGAGTASFGEIVFSETGQYTYTITEKQESIEGYTFDDSVYKVVIDVTEVDSVYSSEVTITKDGDNNWNGTVSEFTNIYKTDKPTVTPDPEPEIEPEPTPEPEDSSSETPSDPPEIPSEYIDEDGTPLGSWEKDPVTDEWVFIPFDEVPLDGLNPSTGDYTNSIGYIVLGAVALVLIAITTKKKASL